MDLLKKSYHEGKLILNKPAPIVLFVYNRPWHTEQTIEALKKNMSASKSELFIYCDAAKDEQSLSSVNAVKNYVNTIDGFKNVTIIEREKNWGLANSIIDGVTKIVNEYGKIIVLEDDLVTSPYFLKYMNDALDIYQNEQRVMSISAFMKSIEPDGLEETFLMCHTSCWGWGTWKESWDKFEKNPKKLIKSMSKNDIYRLNHNGTDNAWIQVLENQSGKINTWAIFWGTTVFKNNGLVLHPSRSMTKNIGHDGSGIHCTNVDSDHTELYEKEIKYFEKNITNNDLAVQIIQDYNISVKPTLVSRVKNKIKRIIGELNI